MPVMSYDQDHKGSSLVRVDSAFDERTLCPIRLLARIARHNLARDDSPAQTCTSTALQGTLQRAPIRRSTVAAPVVGMSTLVSAFC